MKKKKNKIYSGKKWLQLWKAGYKRKRMYQENMWDSIEWFKSKGFAVIVTDAGVSKLEGIELVDVWYKKKKRR